ncbi:hypothetical protein EC844_12732 [Acinetobacter calcoaceticus]|uniref:Uncharacterized protein n=1 Tax=Acinetobacter calcoaceticus TaxID=471 RepID=A0A4R1XDN0_ACICA|nr:hypothetical protein EC844_12732 [Acinetobacter calcoaceticus]
MLPTIALKRICTTSMLSASLYLSGYAYADENVVAVTEDVAVADDVAQPEVAATAVEQAEAMQTGVVVVEPNVEAVQARFLPIWGNEARAKGYDLPQPFGIAYNYMNLKQDIVVDGIGFIMPKNPLIEKGLKIQAGHTEQKSESHMLKLDAWILPFMNVYGLYGTTKGTSYTTLAGGSLKLGLRPKPLPIEGMPFNLEFEGKTYGVGTTLAGGYKNMFATVDINYTKSDLDILDGDIKALMVTPRVGYSFELPALIDGQANSKLQLWTGAMYQDVTQSFRGNINELDLSPALKGMLNVLNDPDMKFSVDQHLAHKWNGLVGARLDVTPHFSLTTEVGFNTRKSYLISGEFRF